MVSCAVAVIGHVDHGKTALVRALTGQETDRLAEEKRRGLSIELGFAHRVLGEGIVDVIDAPGHEDFIRTTASGLAGASGALLVVSCVDGVQKQTLEHAHLARWLGVTRTGIALGKCDLLTGAACEEAADTIRAGLAGTPFEVAPVVACSAHTGEGLDALDALLKTWLAAPPALPVPLSPFLPVDRVFTAPGHGTVVTGTLLGGTLHRGDVMCVGSAQARIHVRGLECRGAPVEIVPAGARVAVNLRGVSPDTIARGDVLHVPGSHAPSGALDVRVTLETGVSRGLRHMDEVRLMIGTASLVARVRMLETGAIGRGQTGLVQLQPRAPLVAHAGQPFALRWLSPDERLGGGVVLDPLARPARGRNPGRVEVLAAAARADEPGLLASLASAGRGVIDLTEAARLLRRARPELPSGHVAVGSQHAASQAARDAASSDYLATLGTFHARSPFEAGPARSLLHAALARRVAPALVAFAEDALVETGEIHRQATHVALASHDPLARLDATEMTQLECLVACLADHDLMPPDPSTLIDMTGASPHVLEAAIGARQVVRLYNHSLRQTLVYEAGRLDRAAVRLRDTFPPPAMFRTGQAREALDTSRKHVVPILERFDLLGLTRREGDTRTFLV